MRSEDYDDCVRAMTEGINSIAASLRKLAEEAPIATAGLQSYFDSVLKDRNKEETADAVGATDAGAEIRTTCGCGDACSVCADGECTAIEPHCGGCCRC